MLGDLAIESITVDALNLGGFGLISLSFGERALDEFLFEFAQSFVKVDASFNHFRDKGFQLLFHYFFLRVGAYSFTVAATIAPERGIRQEISPSFRRESLAR